MNKKTNFPILFFLQNKLVLLCFQKLKLSLSHLQETKHNLNYLISLKQKEIRDIEKAENRDYIKDLSKICIFLESFQKQLLLDYEEIQSSSDSSTNINPLIQDFKIEFKLYKTLISSLVLMISNICFCFIINPFFNTSFREKVCGESTGICYDVSSPEIFHKTSV